MRPPNKRVRYSLARTLACTHACAHPSWHWGGLGGGRGRAHSADCLFFYTDCWHDNLELFHISPPDLPLASSLPFPGFIFIPVLFSPSSIFHLPECHLTTITADSLHILPNNCSNQGDIRRSENTNGKDEQPNQEWVSWKRKRSETTGLGTVFGACFSLRRSFKNREVLKQKALTDMAWHNQTTERTFSNPL